MTLTLKRAAAFTGDFAMIAALHAMNRHMRLQRHRIRAAKHNPFA